MFLNAYEFGRKITNAVVYDDAKVDVQLGAGVEKISEASLPKLLKKFQEINARRKAEGLGILALALPLSACGGSSSSSDSGEDDTPATVYDTITTAGRAIDGYLADSTVSFATFALPDAPAMPTLSTSNAAGAQGTYSLEITDQATLAFIDAQGGLGSTSVKGGVDVSTGKKFTGELKAPEGSAVITPITTLVEAVVSQAKATGAEPVTPEAAAAQVAKGLGLSTSSDLLNTDFVASGSAGMAKAAAKVASVISVVTASSGDSASAAVISNIAAKVAKAGSVGGKAKVLEDTTELAAVLNEVRETTPEAFAAAPETLDIAKLNESIASVVAKTNTQIEAATSLKEIAVKQQAVQEDIVESFTIDYEDAEALAAFDFEVFEASITAADENFDTLIAEAEIAMEAYIAESAEILGIDFDVVLDVSDVDTEVVAIDLDLIDAAIEGTIADELLTGFVFGDVDETILDGVIEGTIDQAEVDQILADLPDYVIFPEPELPDGELPDIPDIPDITDPDGELPDITDPDGDLPDIGDEIPDIEDIPDEILDELPDEIVDLIESGGSSSTSTTTTILVTPWMSISDAIASASVTYGNGTKELIVNIADGRFDENLTLDADDLGFTGITLQTANSAQSLAASDDLSALSISNATQVSTTLNGLAFDTADDSRDSAETWINGTVTVASDNITLSGLRLHSYNGGLKFSGDDIDDFTLTNSYVTGFHGSQSIRYDGDGSNTGWTISGNMIGGVAGGTGGSLYLTEVAEATISDNVFFRPGAAHMYLTDVGTSATNITVSNNLFYHGIHADGANEDGLLTAFQGADDAGWGYVGFSGGDGYGYGFGYGFDDGYGGEDITEMGAYGGYGGYGPSGYTPSGYGLDAYGGGGDNQAEYLFYGRNYIAEVKGDSTNVTFDGNWGLYNSGGIQFWDENNSDHEFTNVTISNNQMAEFVNADQNGLLDDVASRHKSGLVGGVVYQVSNDTTTPSDGLTITGNKIYGYIDQVLNENDLDALIEVGGNVVDVTISDNTLVWDGTDASGKNDTITGDVFTQGIHLYGNVNGSGDSSDKIVLEDNIFETGEPSGYDSAAIYLNNDLSTANEAIFGELTEDVYLVDTNGGVENGSANANATDWSTDADILGNYATNSDLDPVRSAVDGTYNVTSTAEADTDVLFSTETIA